MQSSPAKGLTIPGGRRPLQQRGGTEEVYDILHEWWFDEIEDKDFQEEEVYDLLEGSDKAVAACVVPARFCFW